MLRKLCLLLILFLASLQVALGADNTAMNFVLDPKYWQSFDWEKMETSALWKNPGWQSSEEVNEKITFVKSRTMHLLDREFYVNINRKTKSESKTPWGLSLITTGKTKSSCAEVLASLTDKFSLPAAAIDATNEQLFGSPENRVLQILHATQWTKGKTRVMLTCGGMFRGSAKTGVVSVVLSATHVKETPVIIPMFALICNTKTTFSDGSASEPDSIVLHIDEYFGKIRNRQNVDIGKNVIIQPGSITFVNDFTNMKIKYEIDRITGILTAVDLNAVPGAYTGIIRGKCEKTEIAARKF